MVAEETNTASFASVSATPSSPNRMVSVCAALTTTLTTMSAPPAASAGVSAPPPPSATNRATASAGDVAAGDVKTGAPQRGRHAKAHRAEPDDGDARLLRMRIQACGTSSGFSQPQFAAGFASGYHGLAALPKHETTRQQVLPGYCHDRNQAPRGNLPARPLAVRARADAGLVRQYQRPAATTAAGW